MRLDLKMMADGLIDAVKGYVSKAEAVLNDRIDSIEKTIADLPEPLNGIDGKDGATGKDADPIDFDAVVKSVLAVVPTPANGTDGKDGLPGKDGANGNDGISVSMDEVQRIVDQAVAKALAALPAAQSGRDGRDGLNGVQGTKGLDGIDGHDGKDGLGFDDLSVDYDGERSLSLKFMQGERTKAFDFTLPIVIDRGVYREGNSYEKGDCVTWAGSTWIAQEQTTSKPDGGAGWRLAVKRGRDGKEGRDGIDKTLAVKLPV